MPGLVGFSGRINDPEVIKAIENRNKSGRGCIYIGIPLPLIIYLIVSFVSDEVDTVDALIFGGGVSVVFFCFTYLANILAMQSAVGMAL
jgi:amino acid permease